MRSLEEYQNLYEKYEPYIEEYSYCAKFIDADDNKYFNGAVKADVLINLETILVNMIKHNQYSQGVDSSCRAIMEALLILKMDEVGDISAEQKKIFRNETTIVNYHNIIQGLRNFLKNPGLEYQNNINIVTNQQNMDNMMDLIKNYFVIKDSSKIYWDNPILGDPNLYLRDKNKCFTSFDFSKMIENKKYDIQIQNQGAIYHFFSYMIHPWCETDETKLSETMDLRDQYIDLILTRAIDFIDNNFSRIDQTGIKDSLKKQLWDEIPDNFIDMIPASCSDLGKALETKYHIPHFILDRIGYLTKDICLFSNILEVRSVISKFKLLIEMISLLIYLISLKDATQKSNEIKCFVLLSRLGRLGLSKGLSITTFKGNNDVINLPLSELEQVFNNYYKSQYNIQDFDTFIDEARKRRSFYAFDRGSGTLSDFVDTNIWSILSNDSFVSYEKINSFYKSSIDIEHATGYAAQTFHYKDHVDSFDIAKVSLQFLDYFMKQYLDNYKITYEDPLLCLCQEAFANEIAYRIKAAFALETGKEIEGSAMNMIMEPLNKYIKTLSFESFKNIS